jgi:hypothetical protein
MDVLVVVTKVEQNVIVENMMIKKLLKRMIGLDKVEAVLAETEKKLQATVEQTTQALAETVKAQEAEAQAKMTPKERATAKGEPWVAVLDTHVNKDNVRNGFFELDWNDLFVLQLKQAGYGYDGDPDEEVVDRWFRDLAGNMIAEAGGEPQKTIGGYINVNRLGNGKAEVE